MKRPWLSVCLLAIVTAMTPARVAAQSPRPDTAPAEPSAEAPKAAPLSPALAALQFVAADLPEGVSFGEGAPCISSQAFVFFEDPVFVELLTAPVRKVAQTFRKGGQTLGTVMAFEYAGDVPPAVRDFVPACIWGEGGRSEMHPEQILMRGALLVILSFPMDEPLGEWFKSEQETRMGMPAHRDAAVIASLMQRVVAAFERRDPKAGVTLLKNRAEDLKDVAFAQYFLGEFSTELSDWPTAAAAYARAIELNDSGSDRLPDPPNVLWAALDGQGLALLSAGKLDAAALVFERCVKVARSRKVDKETAHSLYNQACCLSRLKTYKESVDALTECLKLNPAMKAEALKDVDFAEARKRSEFRRLLGT